MTERVFDRDDECYLPVSILLDPAERDMLDEALWGSPPKRWEKAIEDYAVLKGLGSGQRAKLRIAVFFYNGAIKLSWDDARHFDHGEPGTFHPRHAGPPRPPIPDPRRGDMIPRGEEAGRVS